MVTWNYSIRSVRKKLFHSYKVINQPYPQKVAPNRPTAYQRKKSSSLSHSNFFAENWEVASTQPWVKCKICSMMNTKRIKWEQSKQLHWRLLFQQSYSSSMSELVRKYIKDKVVNNSMKSFNYKVNSCPENNEAATKNIQEYKENFKKMIWKNFILRYLGKKWSKQAQNNFPQVLWKLMLWTFLIFFLHKFTIELRLKISLNGFSLGKMLIWSFWLERILKQDQNKVF